MKRRRPTGIARPRRLSVLLLCLHDDVPEDLRYLRDGDPAVLRSTLSSDDILSTDKLNNSLT